MSDADTELPPAIREADEILESQNRAIARMMAGIMVLMLGLLASAFADFEPGIMIGVMGTLTWAFGNAGLMARNSVAVRRAMDLKKTWDQRQIMRELDDVDPDLRHEPEPTDPRWLAVSTLLGRIDSLGADAHVREVVLAVETRLRGLLSDIAVIDEAVAADAALGGDGGERQERLEAARQAKEKIADRLIGCIRDLHVELAVRDSDKADPILNQLESLVMQVEAEAEVEAVATERSETADALDRAQRFKRARQAHRES